MKKNNISDLLKFFIITIFISNSIFSQTIYNIGTVNNSTITTCSGTLVDDGGIAGNYGNSKNYKVTICSGSTSHIRLDFSKISMELSALSSDEINIYDGNTILATQIGNIFNVNLTLGYKPVYLSSGTCITVEFISDGSGSAAGFEAAISCVTNTDTKIGAIATITGCSGVITDDGGFVGNYANSKNLKTTICSGTTDFIKLDFLNNTLIKGTDKLIVYDGNSISAPKLIEISGAGSNVDNTFEYDQIPVQSTGNCITIQFISDSATVAAGFAIAYSCINTPLQTPGNYCSNAPTICNLNGFQGVTSGFYTPNFPGNLCNSSPSSCDSMGSLISIENNSWLSFIANATTASFTFNVPYCITGGGGIQVKVFNSSNCSSLRPTDAVSPLLIVSMGNTGVLSCTGLVIGQKYHIMMDGDGGTICGYLITASVGSISVVNAGPDQSLCATISATLAATPIIATETGTWTLITGTGTITSPNSPTSTITGLGNGTNQFRWTSTGACSSQYDNVTLTVNSGTASTIGYPTDSTTLATTAPATVVTTITGSPATAGTYTATPSGLTISASNGQITPSTSTPGTYTVSATTACGTTTATVVILPQQCGSCATPTCIIGNGIDYFDSEINHQSNCNTILPVITGPSTYVSYHSVVVGTSGLLGVVASTIITVGCTSNRVFKLYPVASCGISASAISPWTTNANGSLYSNPEWTGLTPGNYILEISYTIASGCIMSNDCQSYYSPAATPITCQDYQIQMFNDDALTSLHNTTTFSCTDSKVFLGPVNPPTNFDGGLPYQGLTITITALTGNTNFLVLNRYDPVTGLAEVLTFLSPMQNYFINAVPGQYYTLDKTNAGTGTYSYVITDVITGAVLTSGTWTITGGVESGPSAIVIPTGTSNYSGAGVSNGFDPAGLDNYTNNRGIGVFDPCIAGVGSHTITYSWNNGLIGANNCTKTRTKNVTVTGSTSAPTATGSSICSGSTATITATATAGNVIKWYNAASGGILLFTGNPFTTPALIATTSYWVTQTSTCCGESTRTQVTITITPGTAAAYTKASVTCDPGSVTFSGISSGATFNWVSGPAGYIFTTPTNSNLTGLPVGNYCVDITSPNTPGGTVNSTLLTEDFESALVNWAIDNTGGGNQFIINNVYPGGTCTIGGVPFAVPTVPSEGTWATAGPTSKYLHIKATTTCGFTCAEAAFPPSNANYCSTTSYQKFTLNTPLNTIGKTNVTFSFYYINGVTDITNDYGKLEYSINGGTTWIQSGTNLISHSTWFNQISTNAAWANQASLLFRITWNNNASSSTDPPLAIDQIIITGNQTSLASCGTTVQECFIVNPVLKPTINCGTTTTTSVQFTWTAVTGATGYSVSYQIGSNPIVTVGAIGNVLNYNVTGLIAGASVKITVTPTGSAGTCFGLNTKTCVAVACSPPTATISYSPAAYCKSTTTAQSINLTGTGIFSGGLFTSSPAGLSMNAGAITPSGSTASATPYTVTYTIAAIAGCSTVVATTTVLINATPSAPAVTTVQPTCTTATGSITITGVVGETYSFDGSLYTATLIYSGLLASSTHTFYTKNAAGCVSAITSTTLNAQPATPNAPVVTTVQPTCTTATGSITITGVVGETYSFDGSTYTATLIYSGLLASSTHTFCAKNAAGCVSAITSATLNAQPATPNAPVVTTVQPTCTTATGSITIIGAVGETYSFDGSLYNGTLVYSGLLASSTHTFYAKNAAGCISADTSITLNAQPVTPNAPVVTTVQPTCTTATGSITITGVVGETYSFDGSNYTATLIYSGLLASSTHTFEAKNAASCISAITSVTLNAQPATPNAPVVTTVQPTCTTATGSVTITGVVGETYSFDGSLYTATLIYSGLLASSTHTFYAKNAAGCISAITSVALNAQPATPSAPAVTTVQPTCTTATGSITIIGVVGETYSFDGSLYTATLIYSGLLASSTHTFYAKNTAGCISAVTSVTLSAQPATPNAPIVTTVQPTCTTATGSITITGVVGETYSFDGSLYTGTLVYSGLLASSTHTFEAKNATGCISAVTSITLNAQPVTPNAPVVTTVQPTCTTATGSITITGVLGETYSFDGSLYTGNLVYSGLLASSTHTFYTKNTAGCISAVTSITLNAQPVTPSAPVVTTVQPTCTTATGSITITGVLGETYSFDGSLYTGTLVYSGLLTSSTHTFEAKNATGCISAVTSITLNAQPVTPNAPVVTTVQPTCTTATGSITITGVVGETYSFDGSLYTGTLVYSGLLASSTHTFEAKNATGCISAVTSITLNAQPVTPNAPVVTTVQPTCTTATGSITITGVLGETYSFDGSTYTGTLVYSGLLTSSTHTFEAKNATGCISAVTSITLNAQPVTPNAPAVTTVQPTCTTATGSITITGVVGETYSFDGSNYTSTLIYSGLLASSTHTFEAKNATGCISAVTSITLNAQPVTPSAPVVTTVQPTCTTATGSITITGVVGETYSFDGSFYTGTLVYSGLLASSTHTFYAKNAAGCISAVTSITLNAQPATPSAPIVTTVQPACTTATGSITITGVVGETYSFDGSLYTGNLVYSGLLASSTHTFYAKNTAGCISAVTSVTLNAQPATPSALVNAINNSICSGAATNINVSSLLPLTTFTWVSVINNATGVTSGSGDAISQIVTTTGNSIGTAIYTIIPTANGCNGLPVNITITIKPTPTIIATPTTETICSLQSTGISLSSSIPTATFSWSISQAGAIGATSGTGNAISQVLTATGAALGNVVYTAISLENGCFSTPINIPIIVTPKPTVIATPILQSICSGNAPNIILNGAMLGTTFAWNSVATNVNGASSGTTAIISQPLTTIGDVSGEAVYSITPFLNGCPGLPITVTIKVNPIPVITANPTNAIICSGETTAINLTSTVPSTMFSWSVLQSGIFGASSGSGSQINQTLTTVGLVSGNVVYIITPTVNGCLGLPIRVSVVVNPTPELFGNPTQLPICSGEDTQIILTPKIIGTTFAWTNTQNGVTGAVDGTGGSIIQTLETTGISFGTAGYAVTPTLNGCIGNTIIISVRVNPLPTPTLTDGIICEDLAGNLLKPYLINTGLSSSNLEFEWYFNGIIIPGAVGNTYSAEESGIYSVQVKNLTTGCISLQKATSATVIPKNPGLSLIAEASIAFSDDASIIATLSGGSGDFEYSLDNGQFQTSNIFTPVESGLHTVVVRDINGCTNLTASALVIGYPTYFTPNGDSIHDYWNIIGFELINNSKIFIFDRYGKLIKQINPLGQGWDGTYNGNPMPSTDYWFTTDYFDTVENKYKVFRSHFSLKR